MSKDFFKLSEKYDSIFFHTLLGHGDYFTSFIKYCNYAMQLTNNFIILEHNKRSKDFISKKVGVTQQEIEEKLRNATIVSFINREKKQQ